MLIRAREKIVVQLHYNLIDYDTVGQSDSTTVKLQYQTEVPEMVAHVGLPDPFIESLFFNGQPESLPAGETATRYTWELSGRDILWRTQSVDPNSVDSFKLWGVMPHMHQRGRKLNFKVVRDDGPNTCGADVASWAFDWQMVYFYEEPIEVSVDDTFRVTCTFDTSQDTDDVLPGWGTQYEMCLLGVVLTVD